MSIRPPVMASAYVGENVDIVANSRIFKRTRGLDGSSTNVSFIEITIKSPTGTIIINEVPMCYDGVGRYLYSWNTEGNIPGSYLVIIDYGKGLCGTSGRIAGTIQLVRT